MQVKGALETKILVMKITIALIFSITIGSNYAQTTFNGKHNYLAAGQEHYQQKKDTLFFNFDQNYLNVYPHSPQSLYPIDTQGQEESLFFIKEDTILNGLKPFNIVSL